MFFLIITETERDAMYTNEYTVIILSQFGLSCSEDSAKQEFQYPTGLCSSCVDNSLLVTTL